MSRDSTSASSDARSGQPEAFDGVRDYLTWDYERLEAVLTAVEVDVEAGRLAAAERRYGEFRDGLRRHIRIEEELLFPLFEARTGVAPGPTEVMRSEHREIEQAIRIMEEGLTTRSVERFDEGRRFLAATLPDHHAKKEHILYPTTDRLLSDAERHLFLERIQRE
jgi:hemerythrin-like domain-containing protein